MIFRIFVFSFFKIKLVETTVFFVWGAAIFSWNLKLSLPTVHRHFSKHFPCDFYKLILTIRGYGIFNFSFCWFGIKICLRFIMDLVKWDLILFPSVIFYAFCYSANCIRQTTALKGLFFSLRPELWTKFHRLTTLNCVMKSSSLRFCLCINGFLCFCQWLCFLWT